MKNTEILKALLKDILSINDDEIYSVELKASETWDSIAHINLISEFESKFNIEIEPDDMFEMINYDKIVYILANSYSIEF